MRSLITRIALFIAPLALICGVLFTSTDASAYQAPVRDVGMEGSFIGALNQQRAAAGIAPLTANGSMSAAAASWAYSMASGTFLAHAGDIVTGTPAGWTKVGENVGRGQTVSTLMSAFMNSPGHRRNIMDPAFTHVGVAVFIHPNGRVYTTHRFAALGAPAPAPTPVPVQAQPTAVPQPTATAVPQPAATAIPQPPATATPEPPPTATPQPPPTATPQPLPTATPEPPATATPEPPPVDDSFGVAPEQLAFASATIIDGRRSAKTAATVKTKEAPSEALALIEVSRGERMRPPGG